MNDHQLRDLIATARHVGDEISTDAGIEFSFFPGARYRLRFRPTEVETEAVIASLLTLAAQPASLRTDVEKSLYAYYLQCIEDGNADFESAQHQLDWEAAFTGDFENPIAPQASDEIWTLIKPGFVHVGANQSIVVGNAAAWDGEHGAIMVFRDGNTFLGVCGYGDSLESG